MSLVSTAGPGVGLGQGIGGSLDVSLGVGLGAGPDAESRGFAGAELSPGEFAADLEKLATELLGNQLRAQIALRQPGLRILNDPYGLGRAVLTAQARNARAARNFQSAILPRMAMLVSEATLMGNRMLGLNRDLAASADPQAALEALARITEQVRDYESSARDALAMARTNADITDNTMKALDKAINRAIAEEPGPDARALRAKAAVERSERAISEAVQAILGDPAGSGQGIRDIATQSVSLFGGWPGAGYGARRADSGGAIAEFMVESITAINHGEIAPDPDLLAIRDGNQILQAQYRQFARYGTMLGAAQVIRRQTLELGEAAARLARIAGETDATLATVIASFDTLRTRLGKGDAVSLIAMELDGALLGWTRLTLRTREIGRMLSGISLLFPEA